MLTTLGDRMSDEEVSKLLQDVDPERHGKIRFEPFCFYIMSKWMTDKIKYIVIVYLYSNSNRLNFWALFQQNW